jgi:hypothetical protein
VLGDRLREWQFQNQLRHFQLRKAQYMNALNESMDLNYNRMRTQQKAPGPVSTSWKVAQLASKLQLFLPTQFAFTTAIE